MKHASSSLLSLPVALVLLVLALSSCPVEAVQSVESTRRKIHSPLTPIHQKGLALHQIERLRGGGIVAKKKRKPPITGDASFAASVLNLVNNVAGAGILALSSGMASGTGWFPAMGICIFLGVLSAKTFEMIGTACELTQEDDFKGLWSRTLGASSMYLVDTMIAVLCLAVAVIYAAILGDVFTPLLSQAGVPAAYNHRNSNIIVLTATLLLPMSLLKNMSALAFTSTLGFGAILYTVFFMTVRALDQSYRLGSGRFVTGAAAAADSMILPAFTKMTWWKLNFGSLVLCSNLGLAYIAHYNAPTFFRELKEKTHWSSMVRLSFAGLVGLYMLVMGAGYATFGDVCKGNILLNYHPNDLLATLGRLATGCSILFGFPLVITGARQAILGATESLGVKGLEKHHFLLVSGLLTLITFTACTVKDVSLVVGLTGASLGSFIVYICPALLYSKAVRLVKGKGSPEDRAATRWLALVPLGLFIGGLGVYMTLQEA